ncbi:DNA replication/repair protein RecF [Luteibaculum oceani]|uniref:DNA replication/repair protein RecF n=1 Tax=Luteibaculum oceani TaxID=1294296 RepID=UPI0014775DA5|nr:DNA replication/repair protein RecF [Luteibaculum oceani]
MKLSKLSIINFKNHLEAEYDLGDRINAFCGENGAGKTNVLDAIYALCYTKSFLNTIDSQLVNFESDFFLIQGGIEKDNAQYPVSLGFKKGQKKVLKLVGKPVEKFSEYVGFFPAVVIAPSDRDLIHEGSEFRRRFIDGIIANYDRAYLEALLKYQGVVRNRNALLKQMQTGGKRDYEYLSVWDEQLVQLTDQILPKRHALLEKFAPIFKEYYRQISNANEEPNIKYQPGISENGLATDLRSNLEKDLRLGYTSVGLHKDDFTFSLNNKPIKKFGSQGQQKTYLLALKLTNYQILSDNAGVLPFLLLDDIFDKLDQNRVSYLLKLIGEGNFGQIFISHTNLQELEEILGNAKLEAKFFSL